MMLETWIRVRKTSGAKLAGRLGRAPSTINRLIPKAGKRQRRRPSYALAVEIEAATGGEVTVKELMEGFPERDLAQANASAAADPSEVAAKSGSGVAAGQQKGRAA